jgi:hypothetical protein
MTGGQITRAVWVAGALIALSSFAAATPPNIVNAKLEQESAASGLGVMLRQLAVRTEPAWVAYAVPMISGDHELCCSDSWSYGGMGVCGECQLEDANGKNRTSRGPNPEANLEPGHSLLVFLRIKNRVVERVRVFSEDCRINAGGRTVFWLNDVRPPASVAVLSSLATGSAGQPVSAEDSERVQDGAVLAIALHADPSAQRALESFVAAGQPDKLRERAAFWLAEARGHDGVEVLRRLARQDRDDAFRKKLMFDLYVSKDSEATNTLIESAHNDASPSVRGQALFWIAQKASKIALPAISDAIERDPNTEVKKRAVFALSQLPDDQGVPLLIHVARSNSNPAVRKAAMFWLGQSHDARALAFFEQILAAK